MDFAESTRTVLYVMAAIMAVAAVVALVGLRRGVQEDPAAAEADGRLSRLKRLGLGPGLGPGLGLGLGPGLGLGLGPVLGPGPGNRGSARPGRPTR